MTCQDGGWPPGRASHTGRTRAAVARSLALVAGFLLFGACTPIGIAEKVASVVAKPVLGLAVKDAQTTLAWVDREEKAGRLGVAGVGLAKRCPEAVIALNALRERMEKGTAGVEGFRGLIYYGTLNRYGQGVQAEAGRYLSQLAQDCLPLIPAEKLIKIF